MNGKAMGQLTTLLGSLLQEEGLLSLTDRPSLRLLTATLSHALFEVIVRMKLDRVKTLEEDAADDIERVDRSSAPEIIAYTSGEPNHLSLLTLS